LANFNTEAAVDSPDLKLKHFTGVPIPFSAVLLPLLVIVHMLAGHLSILFRLAFLVVGIGYVVRVKVPKPDGKAQAIIGAYMLACLIAIFVIQLVK
jgi:phosphatidylserine synthase